MLNVSKILLAKEGSFKEYPILIKISRLDDLKINTPINGKISIYKYNNDLAAGFDVSVNANLSCQRCLDYFKQDFHLKFVQKYSKKPINDEMLISPDSKIDILEPIKQELFLTLPAQILCKQDCRGLCIKCGKNLNNEKNHKH